MKTQLIAILMGLATSALAADWQPLFDGQTLDGWEQTTGYYATNGILVCTPQGGKMVTTQEYGDFEMEFDFKLTPGANHGIGIRCKQEGNAAYDGMEIQVLDDTAPKYAKLHDYQFHGSIYGVVPAKRGRQKPVGEWNHERLLAQGDHIVVELNGTIITEAWLDKISDTPDHKPHPGLHSPKGHIALLGHKADLEFRNLRIRDLDTPAAQKRTNHTSSL